METETPGHDREPIGLSLSPLCSPGLIEAWQEVSLLSESISIQLQVLHFKKQIPALWVVFLGGTGTGKSTLFNVLCGTPLSETGVERPKTTGPILYAHEGCRLQEEIPFSEMEVTVRPASVGDAGPTRGMSGSLFVLEHDREDFSHVILADTPDLDSVDAANRRVAENLYLLSDAVIFVASQEKYADELPYLFLLRVLREQRLCYFILNKAGDALTGEDVLSILRKENVSFSDDRLWLLPYALTEPAHALAHDPAFLSFKTTFFKELSKARTPEIRRRMLSWHKETLQGRLDRLRALMDKESEAAGKWLNTLSALEERCSVEFVRDQKKSFSSKNQDAIKGEIRRLFSKYDVLAKPRRLIRETILFPFRFIGLVENKVESAYKEDLLKVRRKIDLVPIRTTVERFNRLALEQLSPVDDKAPLFDKLREPGISLAPDEIKDLVWKAQDELDEWLAKKFESLTASLPRTKRWGIYSTSILWGILILSLEVAVGGGFTILDALLGSALAPFVTKGTVELFAFHEIQKVTRELADRYRKGLLSVIHAQKERYEQCLHSLLPPPEASKHMKELTRQVAELSGE